MKTTLTTLGVTLAVILITFTGCKKNFDPLPSPAQAALTTSNLNVPAGFDWKTTRTVTLNISLDLPAYYNEYSRVTVFSADPFNGGNAIFSGSVGQSFPMVAKLSVPTAYSQLWLQLSAASGYSQVVTVNVSDYVSYVFTDPGDGLLKAGDAVTEPDCGTGCDEEHSGSGSLNINDGLTHCITSSYTGSVNISHGTLQICGTFTGTIAMGDNQDDCILIVTDGGTANISSMNMGKNATMTVYQTATAAISSMTMNQNAQLTNWGILTIQGNFTPNDLVQNFGTMTVNGQYNMNGNTGELINTGLLTINSHWNVIEEVTNNGTIEVFGDMNCNNSVFLNACKLIVHGVFHLNNCEFTNETGYIKVYEETKIQGGQSFMLLKNQSMIYTKDLTMNADMEGQGTMNEVMVTDDIRFNGPNVIAGSIETAQTNGVMVMGDASNFTNGATFVSFANIANTIPTSACNPQGVTPPTPCPDSDSDGVTDCDDDYPNDPDRAYNSYTSGTAVYEDLWPAMGDYDMNDLVNYYKYNVVTNAQNKVVDIIAKFYVRAVGASFQNGFGFQLDNVTPSQIATVTGYEITPGTISLATNGTENNQAKAVIIAWNNAENVINRAGGAFYNTLIGSPVGSSDTVTVTVHLNTLLSTTVVGTPPFNPFIIRDGDRSAEIHLPDYIPTSLADPNLFGTLNDDTNPSANRYYKTATDLPWAINIPADFDYPVEYVDILLAYNHFAEWAQSGGSSYPDWYKDLPGYRNNSNIY
ncbi:MAG: LruC domain-containing protein [Bacteroidales bacterium]|nr:LruC domain-containing protein [Bacteroidales bacterium]